jgi:hypothetical protein
MKYAQQQLHEVIARLQKARATKHIVKQMALAIQRGETVEFSFSTPDIGPLVLSSDVIGRELSLRLIDMVLRDTRAKIENLKKYELIFCEAVLLLAQQKGQEHGEKQRPTVETGADVVPIVVQMKQPPEASREVG